jgi:hypothetical protein
MLSYYALSCGLLLIPIAVWNVMLFKHLPVAFQDKEFSRDIPKSLVFTENGLRIAVFTFPFLMPLDITSQSAVTALLIYVGGMLLYFGSWLALILFKTSRWSRRALGFAAPAYTPSLWLLGVAMLGEELFWGTFYRWWMYLLLCIAFLAAHLTHTMIVFSRNH